MEFENLTYETTGSVTRIALDRPAKLNAVSRAMWTEFSTALTRADEEEAVRAVVLSGTGEEFCAGDDIGEINALDSHEAALAHTRHILDHSATIEEIATPVLAKVDGKAFGVGCEIAALSDVTVATERSTFSLSEPRIGVSALNGLSRLPDLIGLKQARELLLTAREFDAAQARELGLVTAVCGADEIDAVVDEKVRQIERNGPMAVEMTKRFLNRRREGGPEAATTLAYLCSSPEGREGTDAFLDGRLPEWAGENRE